MTPIVFDLDGTLIDSLPNVTDAANALLAEENRPPVAPGVVAGFVGWGEAVFIDRLIAHSGLDAEDRQGLLDRFIDHYKAAGYETRLMPGVADALTELQGMGVRMGICTNKPRAPLNSVLDKTGLGRWIEIVVAGDDLPKRKPDPDPLLKVLSDLGHARGVYVGDSMVDARTAQRAGMPFLLYTEGIRTESVEDIPHDVAFSEFAQLCEIYTRFQ